MIYVITGKTSSGKDSVVKIMVDKYGFNKIPTFTTRNKRKGEKEGITYHYLSKKEFEQKIEDGCFAEWKLYHATEGDVYYGSSIESYETAKDNSVIILTPDGYRDVVGNVNKPLMLLYIYANNQTIKERLIKRGDNKEEAERRLLHDNEDFKGVENMVDRIIYNNSKNNIDDVVNTIIKYVEKRDK